MYDSILKGNGVFRPVVPAEVTFNYAYYPIIFEDEAQLMKVRKALMKKGVNPRRYFYPSLNKLPYLKSYQTCPVSESYANRVLCLPLYLDLKLEDVERIAQLVLKEL